MTLIVLYIVTLVVFLAVDAVMLTAVMKPLFERHIGDLMLASPDLRPAAIFYLFYIGGVLWFCAWPALAPGGGGVASAALNGAILGLLAYGTYEFVNISTLKGWSWRMVAADTLWGAVLTAGSAAAGVRAVQALGLGRV
ncbi:MAG: DUF2177 family protein [Pseudomonadota bacterium]